MRITPFFAAFAIVTGLFIPSAYAQLPTKPVLTLKAAQQIMDAAVAFAKKSGAPGGCIAIVDDGGAALLLVRLDGTFPKASEVSLAKAQTAATFKKVTKDFEDKINADRPALATVGVNMLKGGYPIMYKGIVIGGIGVSGAASAEQDAQIAEAGTQAEFDK
jgi:glc operon protein GlcG